MKRLLQIRFVGFSLVGGFVFVLGIVLLAGLVELMHIDKYLAGILTTAISLQVNFLLNKYLNWRSRPGDFLSQWLKFHATRIGVAMISQTVYAVLVYLGFHYLMVTVLCTIAGLFVNYIGSEKIVFRAQEENLSCGTIQVNLETESR